jgi:subtilisin family serine protease
MMRLFRCALVLLLPLASAACSERHASFAEPEVGGARLGAAPSTDGSYIVVLRANADPRAMAAIADVHPRYVYSSVLNGFAGPLTRGQLSALRRNPDVAYVEPDVIMSIAATQRNAPWGVDRIDQRGLPLDGTYVYKATASNVRAYIIDSGVRADHEEFETRALQVFNSVGGADTDCNGHGTHVAAIVGGKHSGVAKKVQIRGVKVLDCWGRGTASGVIAGIEYVFNQKRASPKVRMVANLSLGGPFTQAVNDAVTNLMSAGVFVAVAAGNSSADACDVSPASTPGVTTVAASTSTDSRASYSNWGACVDLYAPGTGVTSAWYTSPSAFQTLSGTSMASPHVAGVAALYKAKHGEASQSAINTWLRNNATQDRITNNFDHTPNVLVFKGTL